jgi:hypothetical protein
LKHHRQVVVACGSAVLDGEGEIIGLALEIEVGITPSVKLGATPKSLSGPKVTGGFSGVVNDDYSEVEQPLEFAEVRQNGGDVGGRILIDPVQTYEGVEEQ